MKTKNKWELVIDNEIESLMKNQTWIWLNYQKASEPCIISGLICRLKEEHDGTKRYKARMIEEISTARMY